MRTKVSLLMLAAALLWPLELQGAPQTRSLSGYLIDRMCAAAVKDDPSPEHFLQNHTRTCSLMPDCMASGYAIYADGKWFALDKKGNELAEKHLRDSAKERGFRVSVTGVVQGDLVKVESMSDVE